ncbi:heme uptake protein IsdC [Paenibacillus sp. CAU 1782]
MKVIQTLKWIGMFVLVFHVLINPQKAQASSQLADGTYTADYLVLKAEDDSVSMANDYWEKPATVTLSGGKASIRLTINHSKWVTEFKVPSGGGYADTRVISSSKSKDTRLVEFGTDDISKPIVSKIHVTVEEIDYDHDYTIRIVFKEDSFKLIKAAEAAAATVKTEAVSTATAVPTPALAGSDKPSVSTKPSGSEKPAVSASAAPGQTVVPAAPSASEAALAAESDSAKESSPEPDGGAEGAEPSQASDLTAELSEEAGTPAADSSNKAEGDDHGGEEGPALAGGADAAAEERASSEEHVVADSTAESGLEAENGEDGGLTAAAPQNKEESTSGYAFLWWLLTAVILLGGAGILYARRMKKR